MNNADTSKTSRMRYKLNIRHAAAVFMPFFGAFLIMSLTSPYSIPIAVIPLPFILIGFGTYKLAVYGLGTLGLKIAKSRALAILASGSVTLILILKSIGQLSSREFIILMLLVAGAAFYINRTSLIKK